MPLDGNYDRVAAQLYEAVRPVAAHAFPESAADRLAAVATIRRALEAAYGDGRAAETLSLPHPPESPFPGAATALLTPPKVGVPC